MSRLLEAIARLRVPMPWVRKALAVGEPEAQDALESRRWRGYLRAERLYDVWGPVAGSPWEPFHCVTLFAALDYLIASRVGPTPPAEAARLEAVAASLDAAQLGPDCLVLVDLQGPESVAVGARLVAAGFQPVCTFDNWPHAAGLLKPERVLAELLRLAPAIAEARPRLSAKSPPVWLCDRERLGTRPGRPREFDNRYYLDDSLLPGPELLRGAGIRRLVCLLPRPGEELIEDLAAYLGELRHLGFGVAALALGEPAMAPLPLPLSQRRRRSGYRRSSAGGFGVLVPEPSSSGG